jgi:hypothetical protein
MLFLRRAAVVWIFTVFLLGFGIPAAEAAELTNVSIISNNTNSGFAKIGSKITLSFTVSEAPQELPIVTIAGQTAAVEPSGDNSYTATYTMTGTEAEGIVPFTIDFTDADGNPGIRVTETTDGSSVFFDKTAPGQPTITPDSTSWAKDDVTLYISGGSDSGSGIWKYVYRYSLIGSWLDYPQIGITINKEGETLIYYCAADMAGNLSMPKSQSIKIDKTPPVVSFAADGNEAWAKTVSTALTVEDDRSGVNFATSKYAWSQSTQVPDEGWIDFSSGDVIEKTDGDGEWYLHVQVADNAGNYRVTRSNKFLLDNSKPVIALIGDAVVSVNHNDVYNEPGAVAVDEYHGSLTEDIQITGNVDTGTVGTYIVRYNVVDILGNAADEVTRTVQVIPIVEELQLDSSAYRLRTGTSHQTVVTAVMSDGIMRDVTADAVYTTSDARIAAVDVSGVVTGAAAGEAQITVSFGGKSASANINVYRKTSRQNKYKAETANADNEEQSSDVAGIMAVEHGFVVEGEAGSNSIEAVLDAQTYYRLQEKEPKGVLTVKTADASYALSLGELGVLYTSDELGTFDSDVKVSVKIEQLQGETAKNINNTITDNGGTVLTDPTLFNVEMVSTNGKWKEMTSFASYVSHTLIIDNTVDPAAAVGVLYNPENREYTPVPTVFAEAEGKIIATLKHQGNGIYTVIKQTKTFADMIDHWAKEDVEQLASKLIVNGRNEEKFDPNGKVTRAEFTSMLVRALGIAGTEGESNFNDITGQWYGKPVAIAAKAGLVNGYDDGSFKPNNRITREEMAVMLTRAVEYAGTKMDAKDLEETLGRFKDGDKIKKWAQEQVAAAANAQIIRGYNDGSFAPDHDATRAEAAAMLLRTLRFIQFIN